MKIYCVIGDERVNRSLSPRMHNSVFSRLDMDSMYVAVNVKPHDLEKAVDAIKCLGFSGVNVTVPHKEAIIPYLDCLSDEAATVGAVNTLVFQNGSAIGHNTDVGGFGDLLDFSGFNSENTDVMIVGAGGAARAILCSLNGRGARITVINRTLEKAVKLTDSLGGSPASLEDAPKILGKVTLLVNTTDVSEDSVGSELASILNDAGTLRRLKLVIDINYGRTNNIWSLLAQRNTSEFHDGLYMLAAQARRSFNLWTGSKPDMKEFLSPLGFFE
jgi:shikimate dehydrogenase